MVSVSWYIFSHLCLYLYLLISVCKVRFYYRQHISEFCFLLRLSNNLFLLISMVFFFPFTFNGSMIGVTRFKSSNLLFFYSTYIFYFSLFLGGLFSAFCFCLSIFMDLFYFHCWVVTYISLFYLLVVALGFKR